MPSAVSFNPNTPLQNGALPLHHAVHNGASIATIDGLLKRGADPFLRDGANLTATDHALIVGNMQHFTRLIQHVVPSFDPAAIDQVKNQSATIVENIQKATNSLEKAVAVLEVDDRTQMKMHTLPALIFNKESTLDSIKTEVAMTKKLTAKTASLSYAHMAVISTRHEVLQLLLDKTDNPRALLQKKDHDRSFSSSYSFYE